MNEQQAGVIAIIKTATVALATLIALISLVLLAWVHDGNYAALAGQALPVLIMGGLGSLLGLRVTDVLGGVLNNYVASRFAGLSDAPTAPGQAALPPLAPDVSATAPSAESQPEG